MEFSFLFQPSSTKDAKLDHSHLNHHSLCWIKSFMVAQRIHLDDRDFELELQESWPKIDILKYGFHRHGSVKTISPLSSMQFGSHS